MGNYRKKWWEESDLEEVPRRGFSTEENRAFYRGRKYERRRILRLVLWCVGGWVIVVGVIYLVHGCVIFVRIP